MAETRAVLSSCVWLTKWRARPLPVVKLPYSRPQDLLKASFLCPTVCMLRPPAESVLESHPSPSIFLYGLFLATSLSIPSPSCFQHVYLFRGRPCLSMSETSRLPPPSITQLDRQCSTNICYLLISRRQYRGDRYAVLLRWSLNLLRQRLCLPLEQDLHGDRRRGTEASRLIVCLRKLLKSELPRSKLPIFLHRL